MARRGCAFSDTKLIDIRKVEVFKWGGVGGSMNVRDEKWRQRAKKWKGSRGGEQFGLKSGPSTMLGWIRGDSAPGPGDTGHCFPSHFLHSTFLLYLLDQQGVPTPAVHPCPFHLRDIPLDYGYVNGQFSLSVHLIWQSFIWQYWAEFLLSTIQFPLGWS